MTNIDLTAFTNIYIGSVSHLLQATSPTVRSPHGAMGIRPCFRPGMGDCYNSDKIFGFCAGGFTVMPSCRETQPDFFKTASAYDHDFENAHCDLYEVFLEDCGVYEKHTAFDNYGIVSFDFPSDKDENCIAVYAGKVEEYHIRDGLILISRAEGSSEDDLAYSLLDASSAERIEPFELNGQLSFLLTYRSNFVSLPAAFCYTGFASLERCFERDVKGKTFDDIYSQCKNAWNGLFSRVKVSGGSEDIKTVFYTALYRAAERMQDLSVNGEYKGYDGKIHSDEGHHFYANDGIWDTFRGMHPLQLILEPERHRDILESYLRTYEQSGWMARFPSPFRNIPCMIGHHTVSLFAEAAVKGIALDYEKAYEAARKNATCRTMLPWTDGEADELTKIYYEKGFFPALEEDEAETCDRVHFFENRQSAAVTIEHSYDDHCVALLAEKTGRKEEAAYFAERAENYKKLYNPETGFMHPRKEDGSFIEKYDPKRCGGWGGRKYFAENNAYIYNFAAQHDIKGLVELFGGKEKFEQKLDELFIEQYDNDMKCEFLAQYPDATGLMGQFCMGNEPSFHIPYLYNYCSAAYKTQKKIHDLIRLWFTNSPLGICGDEDGGAMSAFLVFSAIGFYPVDPSSGLYDIGSPVFDMIELCLPNGKTFTVKAEGASMKKKYIKEARLNGERLKKPVFSHSQLMNGGELELIMSEHPVKNCFE